jgi:hypothetical protein
MRKNIHQTLRAARWAVLSVVTAVFALGCPELPYPGGGGWLPDGDSTDYELGFNDGFAEDAEYWKGYDDGYDTVDFEPIYYEGDLIPYIEDESYDAGYWDGVWWAYNDGYFVDYRYAFILGFSEGYDNAFYRDYLAFLANDVHVEYLHGGWIDGYSDGFSEGRIFGANDYEQGLPFDWEDALRDYEDGVDLYFEEVDLGTGVYGPVYLYEYGTNPYELKAVSLRGDRLKGPLRSIRSGLTKEIDLESRELYRPVKEEVRERYAVVPETSLRNGDLELRLETTWMERIESSLSASKAADERRERVRQVFTD